MNIQKLIQLDKQKNANKSQENEVEETSFTNKNENKKLLGPSSRRSKSRNNNTDQSDTSVRSPRNDDEDDETSRQPSATSLKGLLKTELESQKTDNRINKRRKKLDLIKKLENDLNDQEQEDQDEGQINKAYESDTNQGLTEEKTKKSRKREPKTKIPRDPNAPILAVIVHQSDKLRTDINMYHPIVRVHIIDLDMEGQYVKNLNRQNVLLYYEKENIKRDYIPPIMTTPYDFKVNRSIIPKWEEIIVFNEDFNYFIQEKPNCLILFEIIDSAKSADSYKNLNMQYTSQDASNSWQRIAWAFLKLVGSDNTPNIEKKIRLQLYYTQTQYKVKMTDSIVPEVYHLYKMGPRLKYPASLHVTVKSILTPQSFQPGIRSMYLLQENNKLIENFDDNPNNIVYNNENDLLNVKENISPAINSSKVSLTDYNTKMNQTKMQQDAAMWSRVANLPCRVPNELSLKLNSSKLGCYSVKFSTMGSYLACACVDDNNVSPLFIYEIPSGKLIMKFQGHFGLIYEIGWSKLDKYIVTASNDATSRIIDVENRSKDAFRILPHPSFLYTAKFHPNSLDIVCTSGYDKVIRVWSINDNKKVNQKYGYLLQEIYGHSGYVNATCFSLDGSIFYSADSNGRILAWNCNSTHSSKESFKDWSLREEIEINDLKDKCINHIKLHHNQFRMIVHLRENEIKLIDLRLQAIIKTYKSSFNFTQNIRSTITPCGSFLFSSSVDTKIYCWNIDSGEQVSNTSINLNYLKPARDIDFHPFDNLIVFCSFDSHSPIYVYKYNSDRATKDLNVLGTIYSQSGTLLGTKLKQHKAANKDQTNDFYLLPNQTDEIIEEKTNIQKKFTDDIAKFNSYQANRWKSLQDKLDSVHPSQNQQLVLNSGIVYPNPENFKKPAVGSSITLTMPERQNNKPEFKYRGPKEVEDVVIAIYDYTAQRMDELDLIKGEEILVLVRENENWWMGELIKNKQQGYFPAMYVQEKSSEDISNFKLKPPKFTVKDAMAEFQKEYEINSALKQQQQLQPETNISNANVTKRMPKVRLESKKSEINNNTALNNNDIKNLDEITQVNDINEVPTRDEDSIQRPKKRENYSRRRLHGHIIIGNSQTSSEI